MRGGIRVFRFIVSPIVRVWRGRLNQPSKCGAEADSRSSRRGVILVAKSTQSRAPKPEMALLLRARTTNGPLQHPIAKARKPPKAAGPPQPRPNFAIAGLASVPETAPQGTRASRGRSRVELHPGPVLPVRTVADYCCVGTGSAELLLVIHVVPNRRLIVAPGTKLGRRRSLLARDT
jgi:hypothetical protein